MSVMTGTTVAIAAPAVIEDAPRRGARFARIR